MEKEEVNIIEAAVAMGRRGGQTTKDRYGREHFSKIAKLPRKRKDEK